MTRDPVSMLTSARPLSGEGNDKAGGYGIQARGGELAAGVTGSFTNVVGLPLETVRAMLAEAGEASG